MEAGEIVYGSPGRGGSGLPLCLPVKCDVLSSVARASRMLLQAGLLRPGAPLPRALQTLREQAANMLDILHNPTIVIVHTRSGSRRLLGIPARLSSRKSLRPVRTWSVGPHQEHDYGEIRHDLPVVY